MSEIRATTISDETGNGPIALTKQHAAKAWTSDETLLAESPGAWVGDSFGVSSITDNGTGLCYINFITAFANTGFCSNANASGYSANDIVTVKYGSMTSSRDDIYIYDGAYKDSPFCYTVHGDLA